MQQGRSDPEARPAQPPNSLSEIDLLLPCGAIKYSQEPGESQTELGSPLPGQPIIEEHEIRRQVVGQCKHFPLPRLEAVLGPCVDRLGRSDFEPPWRLLDPCSNLLRSPGSRQLFVDTRRNEDVSEEPRKEIDFADQDQVANRRGVADDDHSPSNSSRVRASASRSSSE